MSSIIRVNDIQDAGGNSIISSNGSGTVTVGNTALKNTPLIQAGFSSASQSISSGTDTEIVYTTITKETPSGKFSTSTGRFTPGVVGLYYVSALARINGGNGSSEFANLQIRVNGSASINGTQQGATYRRFQSDGAENSFAVHCIVELTSITDYISVYIYQNQGGSQTLQADHTNFTAYKLTT
jgi:hypothetical protein|tara:strand:+ start:35 stop:583 length:549 start_codon:yes stop_codon:yes gene_type:complete